MQNTLTAQYNALPEGEAKTKLQAQLAGISQAVAGYENSMPQKLRWRK